MTIQQTAGSPPVLSRGITSRAAAKFVWALWACAVVAVRSAESKSLPDSPKDPRPAPDLQWSLRPLVRPAVPPGDNKSWPRTVVDEFVLARLTQEGMAPSPPADPRALLRRVYFDLTGLPPKPSEIEAFVTDKSADAYERVVDRLLASPRYGERWARHWMDVVHFAETHGHDQDRIRTNAWPYRDYLIQSFNQDKPYARFVEEQLAGDVLYPNDPSAVVALGFVAAGPWDESSLRDIREDTIDRQIARYLDRDDMVTTAMATLTSTTVHCARCHDHKFDPITREDYYSLQAVFAGVDRAERPFDPDPGLHRRRQSLLSQKSALERKDPALMKSLLTRAVQKDVRRWERNLSANSVPWTVLEPTSLVSSNGATLTRLSDQSVLAGGNRPEKDTYTIVAATGLKHITAFRLEVLADDRLPQQGPGRQDNGNLHLSELRVRAQRSVAGNETNPATNLQLQNPTADFDQEGWTIQHAIDGNEKTAWGIHPRVGKSHHAFFELKEPVNLAEGTALTFVLEQQHGGGHLIGRLRLSATSAPLPVRVNPLPEAATQILATAARQRTDAQRQALAACFLKEKLDRELAALPAPRLVYAGASDFVPDGGLVPAKGPRPIHVLKRGDINRPGEPASPGALSCVSALPARFVLADAGDEGARRAALAKWITDPRNPLTWRSIVNRVWHYHFGRGIVDTPNDFGRMGATPTHPELLDWLAVTFREGGGSLKRLHRLIVTSAVYRQSSRQDPGFARLDSENRYLWRMNRSRLDAESLRDAVLQITGRLDLSMGGPSFRNFALSPGIHVTPTVDYALFDVNSAEANRRSVYRFLFRTIPDPFMDALDCPDASQLTPARNVSVTPLQALALLNNPFMLAQSEHFAERLRRLRNGLSDQIDAAVELAFGRAPTDEERQEFREYAEEHGLANLCRLILNSNEFIFVN